jgi:hypothetical protein
MAKKPSPPPIKKVGAQKHLAHLTYTQIAGWVDLAPRSVIQYASRGDFDTRSIESVLQWVNGRRAAKGLPLIGAPTENSSENFRPISASQAPAIPAGGEAIQKRPENRLETYFTESQIPSVQQPYLIPPARYNPITGDFDA